MEFTELDIEKIKMDARTKLDARYIRTTQFRSKKRRRQPSTEGEMYDADQSSRRWKALSSVRHVSEDDAQEGETLLASAQFPLPPEWPIVWHKIWLAERRDSDRRKRLLELARPNLLRADSSIPVWMIVFRRLWQNSSEEERLPLAGFVNRLVKWISEQDGSQRAWVQSWNEVVQTTKLEGLRADGLYEIGFGWLKNQDFNHPKWASVWGKLWKLDPKSRPLLREFATHWLSKVDARTTGWTQVWKRLLRSSKGDTEFGEELVKLTGWWLDNHTDSDAWPVIWNALFPRSPAKDKAWLISSGLAWLETHLHSSEWPLVWKTLRKHATLETRESLLKMGMRWLGEDGTAAEWVGVWLLIWNTGDASMRSELGRQAEAWLEKHPRDVASASVQNALLQNPAEP